MIKITHLIGILLTGFVFSATILADNVIISGEIDGTETLAPAPSICGSNFEIPHELVGPVQVSSSGTYHVVDGALFINYDVTLSVYNGSYDINNPNTNLVDVLDDENSIVLNSGTDYYFVVQPYCGNFPGVYASTISGTGEITGEGVIPPYAYNMGVFTGSDPIGDISDMECGSTVYNVSNPFKVWRSGAHHLADIGVALTSLSSSYVDGSFTFYDGPFDPARPADNRIATLDDAGFIELQEGIEYRVVAQPYCDNLADRGEWFFVLLPSEPLFLNHGLSGAWANPDTSGQGIFLEIYEQLRFVFMAWFTYDTSQPEEGISYQVGDPGHRWLTAEGSYMAGSGNVTLTAVLATGGLFDNPAKVDRVAEGTISLEFKDCRNGTLTYDLTDANVSGSFPLKRVAEDNAPQCTAETAIPAPFEHIIVD